MNAAIPQLDLDFTRRPRRNRVSYYNSTGLTGRDLGDAKNNAKKQDYMVLLIFRGASDALTPSAVWRQGFEAGSDWLLTSVRRSICTLTKEGLLVKCEGTRASPYGSREHIWKLKERTDLETSVRDSGDAHVAKAEKVQG